MTTNTKATIATNETIYFKASDTEPFWNITLSGTIIEFTSLVESFEKFSTPPVEPIRATDTQVTSYQAETEAGRLIIEIDSSECTNIVTTRMAGSSGNAEAEFLVALGAATSFRIGDNRLSLSGPRGELLIFKKID